VWSADGLKTVLFLNSAPHAVYNLEAHRRFCRTGFPPAAIRGGVSHEWDDTEMEHFYAR
jgi:hypothetical protein